MQPDAACGRRSRPKPEGYSDRLLSPAGGETTGDAWAAPSILKAAPFPFRKIRRRRKEKLEMAMPCGKNGVL